jgi:3-phenylpropionate/trans-cinnamate dioxygenase ferredoxin subunit
MSEVARVRVDKVGSGEALHLDGGEHGVCLVRIGDDFYALADECSHAKVALSEGDVDVDGRTVECWKHGSTFSLLDGCPQSLPATRPVRAYSVRRDGDDVVVTE